MQPPVHAFHEFSGSWAGLMQLGAWKPEIYFQDSLWYITWDLLEEGKKEN